MRNHMYTRRDLGKFALTSLPLAFAGSSMLGAAGALNSKINGVQVGVETYSYRAMRENPRAPLSPSGQEQLIDRLVEATVQDGINCVEFWIAQIEPFFVPYDYGNAGMATDPALAKTREELRQWRVSRPLEVFQYARKKFNDAGIDIYSCIYNFSDSCTDEEIDAAFPMAKALGTDRITANPTVAVTKRIAPFADRHKMRIGVHNHNLFTNPNEIATLASLTAAMNLSPYMWITLDIGHAVAGNLDPVKFIQKYHDRIVAIHVKDRYKNDPTPHNDHNTVEWGKGDVPINAVLQLMKKGKYPFPALIEYEYAGKGTPAEEVKRCYDYMKAALA